VEGAEGFAGPDVEAAFFGEAGGELVDDEGAGDEEETAARIQRLMEEVPLWPAAAIQRGPTTVAMLKRRTSQKPMVLRSWDLGSVIQGSGCSVQGTGMGSGVGLGFRSSGHHAKNGRDGVVLFPKRDREGYFGVRHRGELY
jgi:hypothetical protein